MDERLTQVKRTVHPTHPPDSPALTRSIVVAIYPHEFWSSVEMKNTHTHTHMHSLFLVTNSSHSITTMTKVTLMSFNQRHRRQGRAHERVLRRWSKGEGLLWFVFVMNRTSRRPVWEAFHLVTITWVCPEAKPHGTGECAFT